MDLTDCRRFFAEEIAATANLKNRAVVEALAAVPREQFLGPGPWTVRGEADFQQGGRQTLDADPRHVYHNLAVALDAPRQLFNGSPALVAMAIDTLTLQPGDRVLHVGCGTGYYTALMASCVGPSGRVVAIEVDESLAARARANLSPFPWVEVRHGDASGPLEATFDAILVNAGVTHPLTGWLAALDAGGRMILPLTCAMAPTIGKGLMLHLARQHQSDDFGVRTVGFAAIYSALGVRAEDVSRRIGEALKLNPFPPLRRLRVDAHEPASSCWLHLPTGCLSTA